MKIAYGHNRDPKEFAHVEHDEGRLFLDHGETRDHLDKLINSGGARDGDTIALLALGDLGRGAAAKKVRERIEGAGVTVLICPPPEEDKPPSRRGPRGFQPEPDLDATLREMWGNPIKYTQAYVLRQAGEGVTRNMLNHRYGNRFEKEQLDG